MNGRILMGALLGSLAVLAIPKTVQAQIYGYNYGVPSYNTFYWDGYGTPYYAGSNYSNPYYYYPYSTGSYYYRPWFGGSYSSPYVSNYYPSPGYSYSSPGAFSFSYSTTPNTYYGTYSPPNTYAGSPAYAQNNRSGSYQSFYAGPERGDRAYVRVMVPAPDASVWIDNTPTQQRGFDRLFVTPTLEPGKKYQYHIKTTWMDNGREMTRERTVEIAPGREAVVAFGGEREDLNPRTDPAFRRAGGQTPQDQSARLELGKVVSAGKGRLVITDMDGGNRRTFTISPNTEVMMGGATSQLDQLRPGLRVQVTTDAGSPGVATRVDAAAPERIGTQGDVKERGTDRDQRRLQDEKQRTPPQEVTPGKDTAPRPQNTPSTPR